jgi:prepilin-type N-terminal cleavage/methylation domain-containing protein
MGLSPAALCWARGFSRMIKSFWLFIRLRLARERCRSQGCAGFTLIEVMVAMMVMGIAASAAVMSFTTSLQVWKHTEAHNAASDLAASRVEQLTAVPATSLTAAAYNETNQPVSWPGLGIQFLRNTTITPNTDGSRSINVKVWSNDMRIKTSVNFVTRFAQWE